uniref:protein O-GlcNAcase n=1 Tax=Moina brachiata TaxID=675436 RepID=A0A4Y7NIA3_9CRUS|nr:EOG090X01OH [Moina brachiata]SVE92862.1 EOG090X01OH [Moina brachiata]
MQSEESVVKSERFLCGVVEGFYGRPWTLDQRKDLFIKLREWGMNSYLYAPKDDYKHRAYWRDLYSVEEAEHLSNLIAAAKESNITFIYAISPGLDITYSSPKELATLKRKLDQLVQCGCSAFALLFDDIESEMTESDKEAFQSFAQAQVAVTNEMYDYLNQPTGFLFCPTEYCSSRAVPDVPSSEYLNTVGSKLAPGIDVMWTGPKVISRIITPASIDEVAEVLRRKPVIWDNLHANDYDQKRLFLGPYSGRSAVLLSKLNGVLTNPNCEYGANFVAIHTLAQWSKCTSDFNTGIGHSNEAVNADIKLEQENPNGRNEEDDSSFPEHVYHPRSALKKSLLLWLPEFRRTKSMWGPMTKPHGGGAPPVSFTTETTNVATSNTSSIEEKSNSPSPDAMPSADRSSRETEEIVSDATLTPCLADGTESTESASMVSLDRVAEGLEPMETVELVEGASSISSQSKNSEVEEVDDETKESPLKEDMSNIPDVEEGDVVMRENERKEDEEPYQMTVDDLTLLCDISYLPFEHGPLGMQLLQEFSWLKCNAHLIANKDKKENAADRPEVMEWHERAEKFDGMSKAMNRLFTRLTYINNRELLYDLYPYVWDMRGIVALLNSYVKWLVHQGSKQGFFHGEQEPWVFRGGLVADLQRLLPLDSMNDLFLYKTPDTPTRQVYTIRPFLSSDERTVYDLCRSLYVSRKSSSCENVENSLQTYPDLVGDVYFGAYSVLSSELCFVVEDDQTIVGYAAVAADTKEFYRKVRAAWLPELQSKYPELLQMNQSEPNSPQHIRVLTCFLSLEL